MKVLKVKLKQNQAHYRKEESQKNKMTYPLPPFSTVIGAIHVACGFTEYHPMNLSIQGRYQSLYRRPYTDYCFLNSIMDDRGILVKFPNGNLLSSGYTKVASTLKSQGNSFRKGITIDVHDQELLDEYNSIKDLGEELDTFNKTRITNFKKICKLRKKNIALKKKKFDKKSEEFKAIAEREKEIKDIEKLVINRFKEFKETKITNELNNYSCLVTSLKYYEILTNVELVIHIQCEDESDLETIEKNIYNLKSIGRSEDFVEVTDCEIVELNNIKKETIIKNNYHIYLDKKLIDDEEIVVFKKENLKARGTKYILNKNYTIENKKRKFNKVKVVHTSRYTVDELDDESYLLFIDNEGLVVNLI